MTIERIQQRLQELRAETESGKRMLADLDAKRADLQQTLLRIAGATQVLEELLSDQVAPGSDAGSAPPG